MKSITKAMMTFFVLVILITGLYFFTDWFSKVTGYALGEDDKVKLAQCIDGKKGVLYVSSSCFLCDKQIEDLGETAMRFIDIVVCDNINDCPDLKGVPSWKINGKLFSGRKNIKELQEISGCVIV